MKVIITDIDGVVLNWEERFHEWMDKLGHERVSGYEELYGIHNIYNIPNALDLVRQFNASAAIGFLDPFRDSAQVFYQLRRKGYLFVGVTAMGTDHYAKLLRKINIDRLFPGMFTDVHFVDLHESKKEILTDLSKQFPNAIWVEDYPDNAKTGAKLGMSTFLMNHRYNREYDEQKHGIVRVHNWNEIMGYINI